jgi:hypothetical protein
MFDVLGQRYGKLPSEILRDADSFDLMVFDVAVTYNEYRDKKHNKGDVNSMMNPKEMEDYYKKFRSRGGD